MIKTFAVGFLSLTVWLPAFAAPVPSLLQSNGVPKLLRFLDEPHVVKRDANSRVWQRTSVETSPRGQRVTRIHSVTELETGACYKSNGQWIDSDPQIQIAQDGSGKGIQSAHALNISPDIATDGGIQFVSRGGKQLRSHVLGICYFDWKNQRDVQVAAVRSTAGNIVGKNQVFYTDAFEGIRADVRYTYKKSGASQDIIFREQLPSPADFGMDPATTRVEVWTEFLNPPEPEISAVTDAASGQIFHDILDFDGARIGRGSAFSLSQKRGPKSVLRVSKQWQHIGGRTFLVESLNYESLLLKTADLPQRKQAAVQKALPSVAGSSIRNLPFRLVAKENQGRRLSLAAVVPDRKGFVLDYDIRSGEVSNFTFVGDTTYLISDEFDVDNSLIIEGNAVVKYASAGTINVGGATVCSTTSYRPAIFTSQDDDSVGEQISDSTGSPGLIGGSSAIYFEGTNTTLHDLRFTYMGIPLHQEGGTLSVTNIQCVHCLAAFWLFENTIVANNCLFFDFYDLMFGEDSVLTIHLMNDTVSSCNAVLDANGATAMITNCVFAFVTNTDWMAGLIMGSTMQFLSERTSSQTQLARFKLARSGVFI